MPKISIRLKLTLWYSAVLMLGFALFAAGAWFAVQRRLMSGIDERLAQRVDGLRTVLQIEGSEARQGPELESELAEFTQEVPEGSLVEVRDETGRYVLPRNRSRPFPLTSSGQPRYTTGLYRGRPVRILTTRIHYRDHTYDVLAASSLQEVRGVTHDLGDLVLTALPLMLLGAFVGGYWISRRALAPVDQITRVARSISVNNLSERLAVPQTGDELQRLTETWNDMLARLETAVKRITQFTADASHELRTPISLIRATAELALRREREPERYRQSLQQIEVEADRMTSLTEDLLALARSDSGPAELPLAPLDLRLLVADVVRQSQALAELHGVKLATSVDTGPCLVRANEPALRRLLLILVDNGLKHTPEGGAVQVSVTREADAIKLSVRDSGHGITPEDLPHIFDRFYRTDPARNRNGGAGLGLSIARTIAEAHGTTIAVESVLEEGSCFEVTLFPSLERRTLEG
jgi:heavy metal sensor kinase